MDTATGLPVVTPADDVPGPPQGLWTYADYRRLPDDEQRYELIDGVLYMVPPPTDYHQASNVRFIAYLFTHVELGGIGRVFGPPFDVKLPGESAVQPDVIVVLNAHLEIISTEGIMGAPVLVVEIASPSTATYDRNKKLHKHEHGRVLEYWIADPKARTIELLVLEQGAYRSRGVFQGAATLPSAVVPELPIRVEQFFV